MRTTNSVDLEASATSQVYWRGFDDEGNFRDLIGYATDQVSLHRTDPLPIHESIIIRPAKSLGLDLSDPTVGDFARTQLLLNITNDDGFDLTAQVFPFAAFVVGAGAGGSIGGSTSIEIRNSPAFLSYNGSGDLYFRLRKVGDETDLVYFVHWLNDPLNNTPNTFPFGDVVLDPGAYDMEWRISAVKGGLNNFISFGSIEVRIVPEVSSIALSTISAATMFLLVFRRSIRSGPIARSR